MAQNVELQRPANTTIPNSGTDLYGPMAGPTSLVYVIKNTGDADLGIGTKQPSIINESGCTADVVAQIGPLTITPGNSQSVTIDVVPLAATWSFDVRLVSDDPDDNPYVITVQGTMPSTSVNPQRLWGANLFGDSSPVDIIG